MSVKQVRVTDYDYSYDGAKRHYEQTFVVHEDLDGDALPDVIRMTEQTDFYEKVDWFEIIHNLATGKSGYPDVRKGRFDLSIAFSRGGIHRQTKTYKEIVTPANRNRPMLLLRGGAVEFANSRNGQRSLCFNGIESGRVFTFVYPVEKR